MTPTSCKTVIHVISKSNKKFEKLKIFGGLPESSKGLPRWDYPQTFHHENLADGPSEKRHLSSPSICQSAWEKAKADDSTCRQVYVLDNQTLHFQTSKLQLWGQGGEKRRKGREGKGRGRKERKKRERREGRNGKKQDCSLLCIRPFHPTCVVK